MWSANNSIQLCSALLRLALVFAVLCRDAAAAALLLPVLPTVGNNRCCEMCCHWLGCTIKRTDHARVCCLPLLLLLLLGGASWSRVARLLKWPDTKTIMDGRISASYLIADSRCIKRTQNCDLHPGFSLELLSFVGGCFHNLS